MSVQTPTNNEDFFILPSMREKMKKLQRLDISRVLSANLYCPRDVARVGINPEEYLDTLYEKVRVVVNDTGFTPHLFRELLQESNSTKPAKAVSPSANDLGYVANQPYEQEPSKSYSLTCHINEWGILVYYTNFKSKEQKISVDFATDFPNEYKRTIRGQKGTGALEWTDKALHDKYAHIVNSKDPKAFDLYLQEQQLIEQEQWKKKEEIDSYIVQLNEEVELLRDRNKTLSRAIVEFEWNELKKTGIKSLYESDYIRKKHKQGIEPYLPYYSQVAVVNQGFIPTNIDSQKIMHNLRSQGKLESTEGLKYYSKEYHTRDKGNKKKAEMSRTLKLVQILHAYDPNHPLLKDSHPINQNIKQRLGAGSLESYLKSPSFEPLTNRSGLADANAPKDGKRLIVPAFRLHVEDRRARISFFGAQDFNIDLTNGADKINRKDAGINGGFYLAHAPQDMLDGESVDLDSIDEIILCEGVATVATTAALEDIENAPQKIKDSTLILGGFSVHNVSHLALELRELCPNAKILVVHDNDFKPLVQRVQDNYNNTQFLFVHNSDGSIAKSENVANAGLKGLETIQQNCLQNIEEKGRDLALQYLSSNNPTSNKAMLWQLAEQANKCTIGSVITPIEFYDSNWQFKQDETGSFYAKGDSDINDMAEISSNKYGHNLEFMRNEYKHKVKTPLLEDYQKRKLANEENIREIFTQAYHNLVNEKNIAKPVVEINKFKHYFPDNEKKSQQKDLEIINNNSSVLESKVASRHNALRPK